MEFPRIPRTKETAKKSSGGWAPRKQAPWLKMGPVSSSSGSSSNSSPSSSSSSQSSFLMSWDDDVTPNIDEEEMPKTSCYPFTKPVKRYKISPGLAARKKLAQSMLILNAVEDDGTESEEESAEEYGAPEKPFYIGTNGKILGKYVPIVKLQDFQFADKSDDLEKPFYCDSNGKLLQNFNPIVMIQVLKMASE